MGSSSNNWEVKMKFKKKIITLLALISVAAGFGIAHNSVSTVQAKTNTTTFPKKMRGTWYAYFNKKKILKKTFTKNKEITYDTKGKHIRYLHKQPKVFPEPSKKNRNWIYRSETTKVKGHTWYGINRITMQPDSTGEYYSVAKLKGNSVLGYAIAHGDTFESEDVHWYRSPKLAKKFKKTHYKDFDFKIVYNLD